jgi:hypothetical protein
MRFSISTQTKRVWITCCALTACTSTQAIPSESALVGVYRYHSEEPGVRMEDHRLDRLTLRADGSYELIEGGPTKIKSKRSGRWRLFRGDRPQISLDLASYPLNTTGNEIRLLVDTDVGIWYSREK